MRRTTILFLAGACALAGAESARAGCGDYLVVEPGLKSAPAQDAHFEPAPAPCNGPNCHRSDAPPLTPAPEVEVAPPTIKAAVLGGLASVGAPLSGKRWRELDARPSAGVAVSILRPPRSA